MDNLCEEAPGSLRGLMEKGVSGSADDRIVDLVMGLILEVVHNGLEEADPAHVDVPSASIMNACESEAPLSLEVGEESVARVQAKPTSDESNTFSSFYSDFVANLDEREEDVLQDGSNPRAPEIPEDYPGNVKSNTYQRCVQTRDSSSTGLPLRIPIESITPLKEDAVSCQGDPLPAASQASGEHSMASPSGSRRLSTGGKSPHPSLARRVSLKDGKAPSSPLHWFPRQKKEPFMARRIRELQEKEGALQAPLDKLLIPAKLTRLEREKKEAAVAVQRAKDARREAFVEASWCRILDAAGIPSNEAVDAAKAAEDKAKKALEIATALGVTPDILNSNAGGKSPIGAASINAALAGTVGTLDVIVNSTQADAGAVEQEVVMAVKNALAQLGNMTEQDGMLDFNEESSESEEEDDKPMFTCFTPLGGAEAADKPALEDEATEDKADVASNGLNVSGEDQETMKDELLVDSKGNDDQEDSQGKKEDLLFQDMYDRVALLSKPSRAMLAAIVASRGMVNGLLQELKGVREAGIRRISMGAGLGLGEIMVKKKCRLELEKEAALEAAKREAAEKGSQSKQLDATDDAPGLDSLLKKPISMLERSLNAAKESWNKVAEGNDPSTPVPLQDASNQKSGLGDILVKKKSQLELAVEQARALSNEPRGKPKVSGVKYAATDSSSFGSDFVRNEGRLAKEKKLAMQQGLERTAYVKPGPAQQQQHSAFGSDFKKNEGRLAREKRLAADDRQQALGNRSTAVKSTDVDADMPGLGEGKRKLSKLEQEKLKAAEQGFADRTVRSTHHMKAANDGDPWKGISLGDCMKKHVSGLQKAKDAWKREEQSNLK